MTSQSAGSVYHVSSLRYAEGKSGLYVGTTRNEDKGQQQRQTLDRLFERAEDNYRPGQSSSSTLLVRSNVVPTTTSPTDKSNFEVNEEYEDEVAREGFHRTKARALLAQSTYFRETDGQDQLAGGLHGFDHTGSIYLRNRRARNPLSRQKYEQTRTKRRMLREKEKLKQKEKDAEEDGQSDVGNDDDDDGQLDNGRGMKSTREDEELKGRLQADAEELRHLLPSGSLMETIHYLAAQYYDARGMLYSQSVPAPPWVQHEGSINPFQEAQEDDSEEDSSEVQEEMALGSSSKRRPTMLQVNEGSALVALAVYLEERIKYEMATTPDEALHQRAKEEHQKVANDLIKHREAIRKRRRKRQEEKEGSKKERVKLMDNGWSKGAKRRKSMATGTAKAATANDAGSAETLP